VLHVPRLRVPRKRWQVLLGLGVVTVAGVAVALRHPEALRPTVHMLAGGPSAESPRLKDVPAADAVLARRRDGLIRLVGDATAGRLFPGSDERVLFLVEQGLVQGLLGTLAPREHLVDDTYRVRIDAATVSFEDGLALVRLDGRASLKGADEDVFADVSVFGDLEVLREQRNADVLRARINVIAVDARRVDVVVPSREAERLVERFGESRVAAFAAVASDVEIPVRHEHVIELPEVASGPVRLQAAQLSVGLSVLGVKAFKGRLWITMGARFEGGPPPASPGGTVVGSTFTGLPREDVEGWRARYRADVDDLRLRFEAAAGREPLVAAGLQSPGDIATVVPVAVFQEAVRRIAQVYLDRVDVRLHGLVVRKEGEVHKGTLFGRIKAGEWTATLELGDVQGRLRAGAPSVRLAGGTRVLVSLPLHLEGGRGAARVHFRWDSRSIAKLVCRDFEVTQAIAGRVRPRVYPVEGDFEVSAPEGRLLATPHFDHRYRIYPELDPTSWDAVRAALEDQDHFGRCGLGLDPQKVLGDLQALVARGFVVKLPDRLFRPVSLPTRLTPTVEVQDQRVAVTLTQSSVRLTPERLSYGAWVNAAPLETPALVSR
jgi:hypothetical protein